jgi:2-dehydropantoate 2-reductase
MRNGLAAISGLGGLDLDGDDGSRAFSIRLGGQAVRIGQALGYELEFIFNVPPEQLALAAEGDADAIAAVTSILVQGTSRSDLQRPSMGQDVLKGRKTEIDQINGLVLEKGRELRLPVDAHERLIAAVKAVERGELRPSPKLVRDLWPGSE